jgi:site-specific recombinase XerD
MEQGTPLKDIADLLGHRSIETTFLYTKVDLERLRRLAAEWPEVKP